MDVTFEFSSSGNTGFKSRITNIFWTICSFVASGVLYIERTTNFVLKISSEGYSRMKDVVSNGYDKLTSWIVSKCSSIPFGREMRSSYSYCKNSTTISNTFIWITSGVVLISLCIHYFGYAVGISIGIFTALGMAIVSFYSAKGKTCLLVGISMWYCNAFKVFFIGIAATSLKEGPYNSINASMYNTRSIINCTFVMSHEKVAYIIEKEQNKFRNVQKTIVKGLTTLENEVLKVTTPIVKELVKFNETVNKFQQDLYAAARDCNEGTTNAMSDCQVRSDAAMRDCKKKLGPVNFLCLTVFVAKGICSGVSEINVCSVLNLDIRPVVNFFPNTIKNFNNLFKIDINMSTDGSHDIEISNATVIKRQVEMKIDEISDASSSLLETRHVFGYFFIIKTFMTPLEFYLLLRKKEKGLDVKIPKFSWYKIFCDSTSFVTIAAFSIYFFASISESVVAFLVEMLDNNRVNVDTSMTSSMLVSGGDIGKAIANLVVNSFSAVFSSHEELDFKACIPQSHSVDSIFEYLWLVVTTLSFALIVTIIKEVIWIKQVENLVKGEQVSDNE